MAAARAAVALLSLLLHPRGPSESGIYLSPPAYTHSLLGPAWSSPSAWYVTQWSAASNASLTPQSAAAGWAAQCGTAAGTPIWHGIADGGQTAMCVASAGTTVSLTVAPNGSASGSQGGLLPCGAELDMFLSPTDSAYDNAPRNWAGALANASLADVSALVVNFTAALISTTVTPRCGAPGSCGPSGRIDYAYVTLGLTLTNDVAKQSIFYQVILADTRDPVACPNSNPCAANAFWFFDTLPTLGYSETIAAAYAPGASCLVPGAAPAVFELPVLPRLVWVVGQAAARFGADGDLADWRVDGAYVGPGLEGSAAAVFRVWDFDVLAALSGSEGR